MTPKTSPQTQTPSQKSKPKSKQPTPTSKTLKASKPIKRFYYKFTADNHQGLYTFCEGQVNAPDFLTAGSIIFNDLHPKVKNANVQLSEHPFESKNKGKSPQQTWHSFDQELPDADTTVLTYNEDTDCHETAYYDDEAGTCWNEDGKEIFASHWQHLTSPE